MHTREPANSIFMENVSIPEGLKDFINPRKPFFLRSR